MAGLVLGPLLRYADTTRAVVWVETDARCTVEVLGSAAETFRAHGHHYAVVVVEGLQPGTVTPYDVRLDGEVVWPPPGSDWPRSVVRTAGGDKPVRVAFGSCRATLPDNAETRSSHGADALASLAREVARTPYDGWPDLLFLAGDQVYADEVPQSLRRDVEHGRGPDGPPASEVADFEDYTRLYEVAWGDEAVRWLLSTVPSAMIFDDHDVRDDWNTSAAWRERMRAKPWWDKRIKGALASYWLYQHLGNLGPDGLAEDDLFRQVSAADGDVGEVLDEFAARADREPSSVRWSHVRDMGRTRLLVVDCRAGRVLERGRRAIVDDAEWEWIHEQASADVDHLLVGVSLPWLLLPGIHDAEGFSEALADGRFGAPLAPIGERLREALDLEHLPAFRRSFHAMADLLAQVAAGGVASASVLSGDVHYSYAARAEFPASGTPEAPVWQLVCSPMRNPMSTGLRRANQAAEWAVVRRATQLLARASSTHKRDVDWDVHPGPWFANAVAVVQCDGRQSSARWWTPGEDGQSLRPLGAVQLT